MSALTAILQKTIWRFGEISLRRPYLTSAVSTSTLCFFGDCICQGIERSIHSEENRKWDKGRSFRFGGIAISLGVILTGWYRILTYRLLPGSSLFIAVTRVAVDQTMFSPIGLCYTFSLTSLAGGESWEDTRRRLALMVWPTLLLNWSLWPFVQTINFWLVPIQYRVLVVNTVALGWDAYVSFQAHRRLPIDEPESESEAEPKPEESESEATKK